MGDHPASDPAKPGSKLASMQALGRRGGIQRESGRPSEGGVANPMDAGGPEVEQHSPPVRKIPVKRSTRKAGKKTVKIRIKAKVAKPRPKTVKKAKAVLKQAEAKARSAETKKKPGPRPKVGEPWKPLGISKATYHRRRKAGEL
jgi:hypothetical protein